MKRATAGPVATDLSEQAVAEATAHQSKKSRTSTYSLTHATSHDENSQDGHEADNEEQLIWSTQADDRDDHNSSWNGRISVGTPLLTSVTWGRMAKSKAAGLSVQSIDNMPSDDREILAQFKISVLHGVHIYDCIHLDLIVDGAQVKCKWNLHWGGAFCTEFSKLLVGCAAFAEDLDFFKLAKLIVVKMRLDEPDPVVNLPKLMLEGPQIQPFIEELANNHDFIPTSLTGIRNAVTEVVDSGTESGSYRNLHVAFLDGLKITGRKSAGSYLTRSDLMDIHKAWDAYARNTDNMSIVDGNSSFTQLRSAQNWDNHQIMIGGVPLLQTGPANDNKCFIRHANAKKAWLKSELFESGLTESWFDREAESIPPVDTLQLLSVLYN